MDSSNTDRWVFAYGSLMWQPGFPHREAVPALLKGYHRSFCIYSHHYRGTPPNPGLVLGLDRGGSCRGLAYRVSGVDWDAVKANLDERELVSYAYVSRTLRVRIDDGFVSAYTFVANRRHAQYAGELGIERSAQLIMNARGVAGLNRDYLSNTVHRLEQEGFSDPQLRALLRCVEEQTAMIDIGGGI